MDETPAPGTAQPEPEGVLARLWDAWVGGDSPDDEGPPSPEGSPDGAGSSDDPGRADAVEVFGSDDVLSDQLASYGAVGDVSDGALQDDGTSDVDWT
ncbi:MAG: hypothetical protein HY830_16565 [Actinobacteria bacterium]|nr:hypothetical protein [Actinomycetota bacterium]